MTDRKLLGLAAKAAGYEYAKHGGYIVVDGIPGNWNPLTDDGDALRLAVALSLPIDFRGAGFGRSNTPENHRVMCGKYWDGAESRYDMLGERYGGDKQAATRRAIVRAAAEIGKAMP